MHKILDVQFITQGGMGYASETSTLLVCGGFFVSKIHSVHA